MDFERWKNMMTAFGFQENKATYKLLLKHYSEKHRAYHNLVHINDCLKELDKIEDLIELRKEIEMSILFHDIIYNPYGKNNELKSAQIAVDFLEKKGCPDFTKTTIFDLIISTIHNKLPTNPAEEIIMDIDISILGAEKDVYKSYSKKIRKEYKLVPSIIYRKKRKEILNSFLEKDQLYHSKYFKNLEEKARLNIKFEILELS